MRARPLLLSDFTNADIRRFLGKIAFQLAPSPECPELGPCDLWQAPTKANGYGQFGIASGERKVYAHRAAWTLARGWLSPDLEIDHLCRVRACVNPRHLEPVTTRDNLLRGDTQTARHAATTHCPQGHPYSGSNLLVIRDGSRLCRACAKAASASFRATHRARLADRQREYYAANRDEVNRRARARRTLNRDRWLEARRVYYAANRDHINAIRRARAARQEAPE